MEQLLILSLLLSIHFVADFLLQSNYMAQNKSKSNKALLLHVGVYSLPFIVLISPLYGLINGLLHFIIDYITSRCTTKLWAAGNTHYFFVVIGLDQLLHVLSLMWTYYFLQGL